MNIPNGITESQWQIIQYCIANKIDPLKLAKQMMDRIEAIVGELEKGE